MAKKSKTALLLFMNFYFRASLIPTFKLFKILAFPGGFSVLSSILLVFLSLTSFVPWSCEMSRWLYVRHRTNHCFALELRSVGCRRRSLTPRQKSSSIALEPFEKRSSIVLCAIRQRYRGVFFIRRSLIERIHVEKDFGAVFFVIASW